MFVKMVRACVDVVPSRSTEGLRKIKVVFMSPCGRGVVVNVLTMSVPHEGQLSEYGASQENQRDTESNEPHVSHQALFDVIKKCVQKNTASIVGTLLLQRALLSRWFRLRNSMSSSQISVHKIVDIENCFRPQSSTTALLGRQGPSFFFVCDAVLCWSSDCNTTHR